MYAVYTDSIFGCEMGPATPLGGNFKLVLGVQRAAAGAVKHTTH